MVIYPKNSPLPLVVTMMFGLEKCILYPSQGLLDEWNSKGPAVQDLNSKGSSLCHLITSLTSPAKIKANKSGDLWIRS